jgi:hypothetical protein
MQLGGLTGITAMTMGLAQDRDKKDKVKESDKK